METFSALPALCAGNSPVTGEFPSQKSASFDIFFGLNKQLSKQSWGWWFETPSRSLWRHCSGSTRCLRTIHAHMGWVDSLTHVMEMNRHWLRNVFFLWGRHVFSITDPLWGKSSVSQRLCLEKDMFPNLKKMCIQLINPGRCDWNMKSVVLNTYHV